MIIRNDLVRPQAIPKALLATIRIVGGTNIYEEPLFRLVLAEDRVCMSAGIHTEWDEDVPVEERGGTGIEIVRAAIEDYYRFIERASLCMSRHAVEEWSKKLGAEIDEMMKSRLAAQPLSEESGMKQIPIYPYEGYILEKWKPAESFGSQDDWHQYKFQGMSVLGAYPLHGEYEYLAGPTPHLPTEEEITSAIRQNFQDIQNRPPSARERVLRMLEKQDIARKAKQKAKRDFADAFRKDMNPIMKTLSLGAGRVRQALADRAGIKEHVGN